MSHSTATTFAACVTDTKAIDAQALHSLLDNGLHRAPEFLSVTQAQTERHRPGGGAYSDHLPMVLHALADLGANPTQLRAAALRHDGRCPARVPWAALDLAERGLAQSIGRQGADAVLRAALPERLLHAGAMAFHGLIRTAHAWQSGHAGELALALAWWQQHDQPLPDMPSTAHVGLEAWVQALWALPAPADLPTAWISTRMVAWTRTPGFAEVAPRLRLAPDTLPTMATWSLAAYAQSGDFTVLHLVTACRALAALEPCIPQEEVMPVWRAFTLHAAAALLASRWRGQADAGPPALGWGCLRTKALATRDAHAVKLVHAAWDWRRRGLDDVLCRSAASRALKSAKP